MCLSIDWYTDRCVTQVNLSFGSLYAMLKVWHSVWIIIYAFSFFVSILIKMLISMDAVGYSLKVIFIDEQWVLRLKGILYLKLILVRCPQSAFFYFLFWHTIWISFISFDILRNLFFYLFIYFILFSSFIKCFSMKIRCLIHWNHPYLSFHRYHLK